MPATALLLARRLAQHGVPLSAVLRAYRLGQAAFIDEAMQRAGTTSPEDCVAAVLPVVARTAGYVDRVCEEVSDVYEHERDRWASRRGAIRGRRVRQLVEGAVVDLDEARALLAYDVAGVHVAAVAWAGADEAQSQLPDPETIGHRVSVALGGHDHLAVPVDDHELWLWVRPSDPAADAIDIDALSLVVETISLPHLAVGTVRHGVDGFGDSHREAQLSKGVAMRAQGPPRRITTFHELGPVALLSGDVDALRTWVGQVLGPLAAEGERETWLRDSLRVFLESGGSHAAAAERLRLHRNTVRYRVRRAEELRGRPLDPDRLQVHLALTATQWLGAAVTGPSSL